MFNLRRHLKAFKEWLNREPQIEWFDFRKRVKVDPPDFPELTIKAKELGTNTRALVRHCESKYVSHPKDWIEPIAVNDQVCAKHLLLEGNETAILIIKPKEVKP